VIKDKGKDAQEDMITSERTNILRNFIQEALKNYQSHNKGNLPDYIFLYRDGIGGPTM